MRHDEFFYLFNKKHKDLVDLFYKNNVGGPAIAFDRWQEKGKNTFSIYKHNIIYILTSCSITMFHNRCYPNKTQTGWKGVPKNSWI